MFSNVIIVVVFMLLVVFIFYKRDMLKQIFSPDVGRSTNRFEEQLEKTADHIIERLEEQMSHLEYLLEEANEKIINLDNKIRTANKILSTEKDIKGCLHQSISSDPTTRLESANSESPMMSSDTYKEMERIDKRTSVIEMADLGYDITQIAKTTGISKGEIMLLLQLNKK